MSITENKYGTTYENLGFGVRNTANHKIFNDKDSLFSDGNGNTDAINNDLPTDNSAVEKRLQEVENRLSEVQDDLKKRDESIASAEQKILNLQKQQSKIEYKMQKKFDEQVQGSKTPDTKNFKNPNRANVMDCLRFPSSGGTTLRKRKGPNRKRTRGRPPNKLTEATRRRRQRRGGYTYKRSPKGEPSSRQDIILF
jgi:hypothetical protein